MSDEKTEDGTGSEIIYHFNVEQHRIPLQQFIDTADTTKDILDDFNSQFFDNKLKYGLYVAPSEEGGLVETLKIILVRGSILGAAVGVTEVMSNLAQSLESGTATINNIGQFLDTDMGKFMYEEKTGEPLPWLKDTIDKNDTDHKSDEGMKPPVLSKEVVESFLSVMPSYLLSENVENLKVAGITPDKLPKAFKARNTFYNACIANEEVQGVAFNRSHDSWIERERFEGLRVDPPEETPEPQEFQFETTYIAVHSPDWEFTKARKWQCRDEKKQYIRFIIEDAIFSKYARDKNKNIKPTIKDTMQVQWIYQGEKASPKNVSVLKVISYNGAPISERLSEEEIQKICDDKNIFFKEQEDDKTENNIFNLFPDQLNNEKSELDDDSED